MSRAINLNVPLAEVTALCGRRKVPISAIESLLAGGTRVVLMNMDDTAIVARAFKSKIINKTARRVPVFSRHR
jgi:hypothetical protein